MADQEDRHMKLAAGPHNYRWEDDWTKAPDTPESRGGWAHHGIVVSETGDIISFHQEEANVLVFDQEGNLKRSWESGVTEGHGMTLAKEGDTEYLWIADNGRKRRWSQGYEYPGGMDAQYSGQVVKQGLDGDTVLRLPMPPLHVYESGNYAPTWVAVNEERNGGNGDVWVADGYGENHVHRFTASGEYVASINGIEGRVGAFSCPHAVFIDNRKSEPEMYVADRSNGRVQVYDLEGKFKRAFGSEFLTSPSGFATYGETMIIAELKARLTLVDLNDGLIGYLGDNEPVSDVEGWPNNKNDEGDTVRTSLLETGKFNSPHGMAVDKDGNIYVEEWLIGGRSIKLKRKT